MNHNNPNNMVFEVEEHGGVNIQGEDNDPMEDDDHVLENTIEDDGINTLIHDTFSPSVSDHDDDDSLDVPLLEKVYEPLYKDSQTTLLSTVLLLLNLKVMNGLSNIAMTRMLRFVILFHYFTHNSFTINIGFV
jgi:hypothetical protein